jgi:hypothetical protein
MQLAFGGALARRFPEAIQIGQSDIPSPIADETGRLERMRDERDTRSPYAGNGSSITLRFAMAQLAVQRLKVGKSGLAAFDLLYMNRRDLRPLPADRAQSGAACCTETWS